MKNYYESSTAVQKEEQGWLPSKHTQGMGGFGRGYDSINR